MDEFHKRFSERQSLISALQVLLQSTGSRAVLKLYHSDDNSADVVQIIRPGKKLFSLSWHKGADIHTLKQIFKHST